MVISVLNRVGNTVGKGENACYQYFLLLPQSLSLELLRKSLSLSVYHNITTFNDHDQHFLPFSTMFLCYQANSTRGTKFSCGLQMLLTLPALVFTCLKYKSFKNSVGKGENGRNEQFSPFSTVFSTLLENFLPLLSNMKLSSAKSFSLEESKICCLGKG